jgi:surface polysaccharide O-acyltransferase-like enzyme
MLWYVSLTIKMHGEILKSAGRVLVPLFKTLGIYLVIRSRCGQFRKLIKVVLNNSFILLVQIE